MSLLAMETFEYSLRHLVKIHSWHENGSGYAIINCWFIIRVRYMYIMLHLISSTLVFFTQSNWRAFNIFERGIIKKALLFPSGLALNLQSRLSIQQSWCSPTVLVLPHISLINMQRAIHTEYVVFKVLTLFKLALWLFQLLLLAVAIGLINRGLTNRSVRYNCR